MHGRETLPSFLVRYLCFDRGLCGGGTCLNLFQDLLLETKSGPSCLWRPLEHASRSRGQKPASKTLQASSDSLCMHPTHSNGGCWHYSLLSAPRPPPPNPLQGHQAEGDRGKITPSLMTWSQFLGPAWQKTIDSLPKVLLFTSDLHTHPVAYTCSQKQTNTHILKSMYF